MSFFHIFNAPSEQRDSSGSQNATISTEATGSEWRKFFGIEGIDVGEVCPDLAMEISAVYAVVNFISDQFASLPCHVYKTTVKGGGVVKAEDSPLHPMLTGVVNDNFMTSGAFRKALAISILLNGRAYAFIERTKAGEEKNFRPLEYDRVEPRIRNGKLEYKETRLDNSFIVHPASDILDFNPQPKMDGVSHYNPVYLNRNTLKQMIAVERFSAGVFRNNGVPPLQLVSTVTRFHPDCDKLTHDLVESSKRRVRDFFEIDTDEPENDLNVVWKSIDQIDWTNV